MFKESANTLWIETCESQVRMDVDTNIHRFNKYKRFTSVKYARTLSEKQYRQYITGVPCWNTPSIH